jgi:hypothetical protein
VVPVSGERERWQGELMILFFPNNPVFCFSGVIYFVNYLYAK